jgi:transposase
MTRSLIWWAGRAEHLDVYAYAWFRERCHTWARRASPTLRQSHAAGETVFVDFAGDTIDVTHPIPAPSRR